MLDGLILSAGAPLVGIERLAGPRRIASNLSVPTTSTRARRALPLALRVNLGDFLSPIVGPMRGLRRSLGCPTTIPRDARDARFEAAPEGAEDAGAY